jgi:hypothetical protein
MPGFKGSRLPNSGRASAKGPLLLIEDSLLHAYQQVVDGS